MVFIAAHIDVPDILQRIPKRRVGLDFHLKNTAVEIQVVYVAGAQLCLQCGKNPGHRYLKKLSLGSVQVQKDLRHIRRIGAENPAQGRVLIGGHHHGAGHGRELLGALILKGLQLEVEAAGVAEALNGGTAESEDVGGGDGRQLGTDTGQNAVQMEFRGFAFTPGVQNRKGQPHVFTAAA